MAARKKGLLEVIAGYVLTNSQLSSQYSHSGGKSGGFRNPWNYGNDIVIVRDEGPRLGLIKPPVGSAEVA